MHWFSSFSVQVVPWSLRLSLLTALFLVEGWISELRLRLFCARGTIIREIHSHLTSLNDIQHEWKQCSSSLSNSVGSSLSIHQFCSSKFLLVVTTMNADILQDEVSFVWRRTSSCSHHADSSFCKLIISNTPFSINSWYTVNHVEISNWPSVAIVGIQKN